MNAPVRTYFSFFRIRFLGGLQYRTAALAGVSTQFAWGMMNILLYRAFYQSDPAAFPMQMRELTAYIWLNQAFLALFNTWYYDKEILESIESGAIAYELARPLDLYAMWFTRTVSVRVSRAALRCLPILIVAAVLPEPYGISLPVNALNGAVFLVSMALSLICVSAFGMIVYVVCFHTLNSAGFRIVSTAVSDFLAGGVIPLPFMPDGLRKIVELSPFGVMQNLPFRIYSGHIAGAEMGRMMLLQVFWCAALILFGRLWMKTSLKKIAVQGG